MSMPELPSCGLCGMVIPSGWALCLPCARKVASLGNIKASAKIAKAQQNSRYQEQWFFPSGSNPNIKYKVSRKADDTYECDCPAWKFRLRKYVGPRADCKHIAQVRAEKALENQPAPAPKPEVKRRRFFLDDED